MIRTVTIEWRGYDLDFHVSQDTCELNAGRWMDRPVALATLLKWIDGEAPWLKSEMEVLLERASELASEEV